jgi:diguanylate cyclase (GGDEF)-like protein
MDFRDAERKLHFQLSLFIGLTGFLFLVAFGLNAVLNQQMLLAASLLLTAAFGLFALLLMWLTNEPRYGELGVSIGAAYIFLYLVITGGLDGTGLLWCYPLVVIVTFLQGMTRGAYVVAALTIASAVALYVPDLPISAVAYPDALKSRFLFSFVALAIMTLIYEHLRTKSQLSYQQLSDRLDRASRTDELTKLANRREMQELLDAENGIYARYGHAFSVIMVDLDHFKVINDRYGHAVGDHLLVEIADCLRRNVRKQDRVGRWGGEEFLVLLPQTRLPQAQQTAEKLRVAVHEMKPEQLLVGGSVTASFGVQSIEEATGVDDLVRQADHRMYEAKRQGRDCVVADGEGLPQQLLR